MSIDHARARSFIDQAWGDTIVPTLVDYIAIPNKSPAFDADWAAHGYMDDAVALVGVGVVVGLARRRLFETFVLVGFGYLGIRHQRLILPMAMAAAPALAAIGADARVRTVLARKVPRVVAAIVAIAVMTVG